MDFTININPKYFILNILKLNNTIGCFIVYYFPCINKQVKIFALGHLLVFGHSNTLAYL